VSHSLFVHDLFLRPLSDSFIFLTLTRLVVVIKFVNFRFALFTPSRRLSKSNNEHKNTLSQVPNGIELIWRLREDSIYLMCLGVKSFALVLNEMYGMLGLI
jgi:hypothetical protein